MRKLLILTLMFWCSSMGSAQTIDTIIIKGLTKTSPDYIRGLIHCKEGGPFDSTALKTDEQILNNLNLFFSVQSDWHTDDSGQLYTVYLIIEESTYVYPILTVSGFKTALKIQAGVNNINFKGEQKTIGFLYQYYDRHSFSAYHKVPRHKNNKTGHDLFIGKYSTVEPLYFNDLTSIFNFDNYSIALNGRYWINQTLKLELGLTPIYERYEQRDDVEIPVAGKTFDFIKFRVNSNIDLNKLNYRFERINGYHLNLYAETIQTHQEPMASFFLIKSHLALHRYIKRNGNLSIRHQFGLSTNQNSPFSPFVLDGFLNLRGIGNRVARGTGIHFTNIEYRHALIRNQFLIAQLVGFIDAGNIRAPGTGWENLFTPQDTHVFTGLGIRLHAQKIYKTIFRLDYGIKISTNYTGGFSFGINQFF